MRDEVRDKVSEEMREQMREDIALEEARTATERRLARKCGFATSQGTHCVSKTCADDTQRYSHKQRGGRFLDCASHRCDQKPIAAERGQNFFAQREAWVKTQ